MADPLLARRPDEPVGTDHVRRANTALLLRALRENGTRSRAELAKTTGLAKGTVGTIVGRLQEIGAIGEVPAGESPQAAAARGRPGTPLRLDGGGLIGLGVEVNVDYTAAVAVDLAGRRVFLRERVGAAEPQDLRGFVADCYSQVGGAGRVLGVTVAAPGLVDRARGLVVAAPNLGWTDLDVEALLRDVVDPGCAIEVDNDANCAALAEVVQGVAVGHRDVLYVTGTIGVGGGIVSGGQVLRGARGYAGEIGHMRIGSSTARCVCGRRGCWEAQVGLRAMLSAVGLSAPPDAEPMAVGAYVAEHAAREQSVRDGLTGVAEALATGTAVLANALNPSLIVLGGYFGPLGPWLLPIVQRALEEEVFAPDGCRVALSSLGIRAAATGGALEIVEDVFQSRIAL